MVTFNAVEVFRNYGPRAADGVSDIHPVYSMNTFVGLGEEPPGGRPCLLMSSLFGFAGSPVKTVIDEQDLDFLTSLAYRWLLNGGFVGWVVLPVPRSNVIPDLPDKVQATFDPLTNQFGPAYPRGCGSMVGHGGTLLTGSTWPGNKPPGYPAELPHPWQDPLFPMAMTGAAYVVQHARHYSRQGLGAQRFPEKALPINGDAITVAGNSASAMSMAFPLWMPNLAGKLGYPAADDAQHLESTRVRAGVLAQFPSDLRLYKRNGEKDEGGAVAFKPFFLVDKDSGPTYDEPAGNGANSSTGLPAIDESLIQWGFQISPLVYGTDEGEAGRTALNSTVPVWIMYGEESRPEVLAVANRWDGSNPPPTGIQDQEEVAHPIACGYRVKGTFPDSTYFMIVDETAVDPNAESTGGGYAHDRLLVDSPTQRNNEVAQWAIEHGGYPLVPQDEKIIQAIEQCIAGINPANGYVTHVREVSRYESTSGADRLLYPRAELTIAETSDGDPYGADYDKRTLTVRLILKVHGRPTDSPQMQVSCFLNDVDKALKKAERAYRENPKAGAFANVSGFGDLRVPRSIRAADHEDEWWSAVVLVEVDYTVRYADPYLGPSDTVVFQEST